MKAQPKNAKPAKTSNVAQIVSAARKWNRCVDLNIRLGDNTGSTVTMKIVGDYEDDAIQTVRNLVINGLISAGVAIVEPAK